MDLHHNEKVEREKDEAGRLKLKRFPSVDESDHHRGEAGPSDPKGHRRPSIIPPSFRRHPTDAVGEEIKPAEAESQSYP